MRFTRVTLAILVSTLLIVGFIATQRTAATVIQGPYNLVAWDSGRYVQLNWDLRVETALKGYNVYRAAKSPDHWEKLNDEVITGTSFIDFTSPRSQLVFYRVNEVNEDGSENFSASVLSVSTTGVEGSNFQAEALTFDKNNIISDSQLRNANAMSAGQIQTFLTNQGGVLATYSTGGKSAAQHIYDNCQLHGISPYVVLVTLQKEKGLIKSSTANPNNFAMGWNTGDSSTSDFANQIYYGTRQFRRYYDNLGSYGWVVGQAHAVSDGTITAANTATAGLYIYTPWIGQGGGGRTGVGGNYLFWDLWTNTFGFESSGSSAAVVLADGFDFPVGKPNATGYAITGWGFLQWTGSVYHPAEDWNGTGGGDTDLGDPVYAAANGVVIASGNYGAGWGNIILVQHDLPSGGRVWSQYAHLQTIVVGSGNVSRGQKIGTIGKGFNNEYSAHLHFEIRKVSLAADAWVSGFSQSQVLDRYHNPSNFINANRGLGCSIAVGQGTSGAELQAFQNAYNAGGGQAVLGCATSNVRFDGFTSFTGTIGHYQTFANGDIEYHVNGSQLGKAFALVNPFSAKWANLGYVTSNPLGYPTSNRVSGSTSCGGSNHEFQSFEGGSLTHHLSGARKGSVYEVHGAIHAKWSAKGFANCPLGLPVSDERNATSSKATGKTGRVSDFERGHIHWWTGAPQAFETHGAIDSLYTSMGGTGSWLGFPTSDEYIASTGRPRSDFEGGFITTSDGINYQAFPTNCSYTLSSTGQTFSASGGSSSVGVSTGSGCPWTAVSNSSFITITSGGNGSGSGSVSYSVTANTSTTQRSGTITVAGKAFTVTQNGASTGTKAVMTSPANGSTFSSGSVTFNWSSGSGASSYWLYLGSSPGAADLYNQDQGTSLSRTVSGLPADGRNVYATLWSFVSSLGGWVANQYSYKACDCGGVTVSKAVMTSPANGATFNSGTVTFNWSSGTGASGYWLYLGNSPGANDLLDQNQGTSLTRTVSGLPTDGRPIYATLWSYVNSLGGWVFNQYSYKAFSSVCTFSISPTGQNFGSGGGAGTLTVIAGTGCAWSAVSNSSFITVTSGSNNSGSGTVSYSVGSNSGASRTGTLTIAGKTFTVTQDPAVTSGLKSQMISPANGATLNSSTVSFSWTAGTATSYWLYLGSTPGAADLYNQDQGTSLSRTVSGLPTDGRTIYATLWSYVASLGGWVTNQYSYKAGTTGSSMVTLTATPANVGPGSSVTVSWNSSTSRAANDWIGLYLQGAPDTAFIAFQYVGSTGTSGSRTFTMPGKNGVYEFRYFLTDGYTKVATTTVSLSGGTSASDIARLLFAEPAASDVDRCRFNILCEVLGPRARSIYPYS